MSKRLAALGAFIFAGGFTTGVRDHFDVDTHFEFCKFGVPTAEANLGIQAHIDPDQWPVKRFEGIPFIYTNPPCAPWSQNRKTVKTTMWYDHPGFACSRHTLRLLQEARPTVWVQESVTEMAKTGRAHVNVVAEEAAKLGYATTLLFHDGKFLGLPQCRRRVFLICHKVELQIKVPEFDVIPAGKALEGAPVVREFPMLPSWAPIIQDMEPGTRIRSYLEKHQVTYAGRKFRAVDLILDPERVSPTVLGYNPPAYIHWSKERFLHFGELARLCSYPDDYIWPKSASLGLLEMTRAVTPAVGRWIAGEVKHSLEANDKIDRPYFQEVHLTAAGVRNADNVIAPKAVAPVYFQTADDLVGAARNIIELGRYSF